MSCEFRNVYHVVISVFMYRALQQQNVVLLQGQKNMEEMYKQLQKLRSGEVPPLKLEIETLKTKLLASEASAVEIEGLKLQVQRLESEAKEHATHLEAANKKLHHAVAELEARTRTEKDLRREVDLLRADAEPTLPAHAAGYDAKHQAGTFYMHVMIAAS